MTTLARSASLADLDAPQQGPPTKDEKAKKKTSHRTSTGGVGHQKEGAGSNWKWLQNSKSFHENRLIAPSTQSFFAAQAQASASSGDHYRGKKKDSSANLDWRQKAAYPLYLEHLETLLPQYCQHLSNPTYQEAANAMSLLLNSNYPKLPPDFTGLSPGSPDKKSRFANRSERDSKATVTSEMNRLLSSPFRVRKSRRAKQQEEAKAENAFRTTRWSNVSSSRSILSSQNSNASPDLSHHSIKHNSFFNNKVDQADAAAWNDFVAPLVLLAGAEAIYADLEHIHPNPTLIKWQGLYERVVRELQARLPAEELPTPIASPEAPLNHPEPTPVSPPNSPPQNSSALQSTFPRHPCGWEPG